MSEPKRPFVHPHAHTVRWYRKNAWVTAMVAGTFLMGPLMAFPVLLILCTGPVYSGPELKPWDKSTKALVLIFSLFFTVFWMLKVVALLIRAI